VRDILQGNRRGKLIDWLKIDSWIDSGLYSAWTSFRDWWSGYSSFFNRFEVNGFVRSLNEFACEALTLSVGGLLILASFALPAFETAQGKMNLADEYSVTFLDRFGNEIGKRGLLRDDSVPLEEIPDVMIKATLATEDRRFFEHFGIDVMGTFRALAANARSDQVVQGGSSLTQQLAKNMFLTPERSLVRKIKEALIAIYLENRYTKPEILKLYFDRAYLGGGSYGAEAAAQYYFNKSIREVNLPEAAMLAGMFKAPTRYAPHVNLAASRARANEVLSNMVEAGFMSEGQVYGARMNPAKIVERGDGATPDYFLDWAFEEVQRLLVGKEDHIVIARTTVDLGLQRAAEEALVQTVKQFGKSRNFDNGALISMETDGAVRAMVGGKDYGESQFNRASHAFRQPGSSFKGYVYLTALQNGFTPETTVSDSPVSCGRWAPKNYSGGFRGRMTLRTALAKSINTIAVKLSLQAGREKVLADLNKMGIKNIKKTCSLALGDNGMTPLEHTGGYAVFAAGGLEVRPYAIEEIKTLTGGEIIYNHERDELPRKQIFETKVIEQLNTMLQAVVLEGTGKAAQLDYTYSAGKTGTSSAYRDAWFIGFTGQYVTGVWVGNDDFTPMARVTGGSYPAQIWHAYMMAAHDTDNIAQIPGLPVHPVQAAEQERIAATLAQNANANANAEVTAAPAPESVKDMSTATRQVLEKLSGMLKDARQLEPGDAQARPDRAEAPAAPASGSQPAPSLAAANAGSPPEPEPGNAPAAPAPATVLSAGRDDNAATAR
jgi:penicillin-binding protein 1A